MKAKISHRDINNHIESIQLQKDQHIIDNSFTKSFYNKSYSRYKERILEIQSQEVKNLIQQQQSQKISKKTQQRSQILSNLKMLHKNFIYKQPNFGGGSIKKVTKQKQLKGELLILKPLNSSIQMVSTQSSHFPLQRSISIPIKSNILKKCKILTKNPSTIYQKHILRKQKSKQVLQNQRKKVNKNYINDISVHNVQDRLQLLYNKTFSLTNNYQNVINHLNDSNTKETKEQLINQLMLTKSGNFNTNNKSFYSYNKNNSYLYSQNKNNQSNQSNNQSNQSNNQSNQSNKSNLNKSCQSNDNSISNSSNVNQKNNFQKHLAQKNRISSKINFLKPLKLNKIQKNKINSNFYQQYPKINRSFYKNFVNQSKFIRSNNNYQQNPQISNSVLSNTQKFKQFYVKKLGTKELQRIIAQRNHSREQSPGNVSLSAWH